jgi:hypothetical protein
MEHGLAGCVKKRAPQLQGMALMDTPQHHIQHNLVNFSIQFLVFTVT